jgi:hypothetical protein
VAYLASVAVKNIRQDDRLRTCGHLSGVLADRLGLGLGIQVGHIVGGGLPDIPYPMTIRQSFLVWAFYWTFSGGMV